MEFEILNSSNEASRRRTHSVIEKSPYINDICSLGLFSSRERFVKEQVLFQWSQQWVLPQ